MKTTATRRVRRAVVVPLLIWAAASTSLEAQDNLNPVPPFRIFDNLYYVGLEGVSAYVLTTSDGLILIDALYPDQDGHIFRSVGEMGLDPDRIRYVIVTHAHLDHAGGAGAIQERTGARVGMAEGDWEIYERGGYLSSSGVERVFPPMERDWVIADGDTLTLGDTTLQLYVTPGHTPGVTSLEFTVHDGPNTHRAFMLGGLGLNTVYDVAAAEQYVASVQRALAIPGLEVNLTNHPAGAEIFERRDRLAARRPGDSHPFVDPEGLRLYLDMLLRRGAAHLEDLASPPR